MRCDSLKSILQISLTPILINRAALSLKKSADQSQVNKPRGTEHLSSIKFKPKSTVAVSETVVGQPPDSSTGIWMGTRDHVDISTVLSNARDLGCSLDQDSKSVV